MNPIKWLFRDPEIREVEERMDEQLERIKEKVRKSKSEILVEVDIDFPERFNQLSEEISLGNVEWRDFYSNALLDVYSVHCRMSKGSMIKEHRHPNFYEFIYVISGSIVVWMDGDAEGKIIAPPEEAKGAQPNMDAWHKIKEGTIHRIQGLEDNTHFVSKFLKSNVRDIEE